MGDQGLIQVVLIVLFLAIALLVVLPGKTQRGKALQRLAWLLAMLLAVLAVAFPDMTTRVANLLGVGRGSDLLLYALAVAFAGYLLLTTMHRAQTERTLTQLARKVALLEAQLMDNGTLSRQDLEEDGSVDAVHPPNANSKAIN